MITTSILGDARKFLELDCVVIPIFLHRVRMLRFAARLCRTLLYWVIVLRQFGLGLVLLLALFHFCCLSFSAGLGSFGSVMCIDTLFRLASLVLLLAREDGFFAGECLSSSVVHCNLEPNRMCGVVEVRV